MIQYKLGRAIGNLVRSNLARIIVIAVLTYFLIGIFLDPREYTVDIHLARTMFEFPCQSAFIPVIVLIGAYAAIVKRK